MLKRRLQGFTARRESLLYVLGLLGVLLVLYWPAASLRGVFFVGDIYRLGYPARQEYATTLAQGRIPLWTTGAVAGYPVLAEGQTSAYYPLNLLLYRLLPLPAALNYSVLISLWIAGVGLFAYVRSLGLRRLPAFLAACVFMVGGFLPGHLNHLNMLSAVAWLPLLLWAVERATRQATMRNWALVGLLFGLQGLAGHPQICLLSGLVALGQALVGPLAGGGRFTWRRQLGQVLSCAAALLLGAAVAAVQLVPTYELTRLSQRGQGLDTEFFLSFSINPLQLITMLWPFVRGNPYPLTSLETIGYAGILPLVFALLAPLRRRDRLVAFWTGTGVLALLLCLGRWNPLYHYLQYVPFLNMFRAPARYLLWVDLAIAVLAGVTFESLLALTREPLGLRRFLAPAGGLMLVGVAGVWLPRVPLDGLVAAWRVLPVAWLVATAGLVLLLVRRPSTGLWAGLVVGLALADLGVFNGVYNRTYNAVMAPADFGRPPESVSFLQADAGSDPYRIYTSEKITPVLSVMRESLFPNIQLLQGVQSVNGYYPLMPGPQQWLLAHVNPRLINLLNVRYVLIPQILPVDAAAEAYDTEDPFAPSIVGRSFDLAPRTVAALEVEGYLSHAADTPDGTPVGQIIMRGAGGETATWTLRAGDDLGEWAYSRDDVLKVAQHRLPARIVRTWPARSGLPPRDHVGYTYISRFTLPAPLAVTRIEVRGLIPEGFLRLERLRLIDPDGNGELLSTLTGEGDHILVYRSPDVAIFRNTQAGPRALIVHRTVLAQTEEQAQQLTAVASFRPEQEVVLLHGKSLSGERLPGDAATIEAYTAGYVKVRAMTVAEAYLVLADSYYPGWLARVDGQPAAIERADVALRAVALPPGEHTVEFWFRPLSWKLGAWASLLAWAGAAALFAVGWLRSRRST